MPTALTTHHDEWTDAFARWLAAYRSARTRRNYQHAWAQFMDFTNFTHPGAVEPSHVEAWKLRLRKSAEPTTINLNMSALSSFYRYVNEHYAYLRDDNPAAGVRRERVNIYGKATRLKGSQDVELLESIDTSTLEGVRDYAIIRLFLTTGVRLDAVVSARVDSLKRQGAAVVFSFENKGGGYIEKELPAGTLAAVQAWLRASGRSGDMSLFGMSRRMVQGVVKRRCDAVFGTGHRITPHSLRHTAAMNAVEHGTIQDVTALLVHKSTRVTLTYLEHIDNSQAERASSRLDQRYAGSE